MLTKRADDHLHARLTAGPTPAVLRSGGSVVNRLPTDSRFGLSTGAAVLSPSIGRPPIVRRQESIKHRSSLATITVAAVDTPPLLDQGLQMCGYVPQILIHRRLDPQ